MDLNIISWNVNGIRAAERKGFTDWLINEAPDIMCVQETKADVSQLATGITNIDGYNAYFSSARKKGYSGVGLWSRHAPEEVKTGIDIERFDSEGRILRADYGVLVLYNIYFPNGGASSERLEYKMDFYETFIAHVKDELKIHKKIVICGDFNTAHKEIDLARPGPNSTVSGFLPRERLYIDKLVDTGFIDTFRKFNNDADNYTWWDYKTRARERNVGWRIDYFFVSSELEKDLKGAFIMGDVQGSDHCPVGIRFSI